MPSFLLPPISFTVTGRLPMMNYTIGLLYDPVQQGAYTLYLWETEQDLAFLS